MRTPERNSPADTSVSEAGGKGCGPSLAKAPVQPVVPLVGKQQCPWGCRDPPAGGGTGGASRWSGWMPEMRLRLCGKHSLDQAPGKFPVDL